MKFGAGLTEAHGEVRVDAFPVADGVAGKAVVEARAGVGEAVETDELAERIGEGGGIARGASGGARRGGWIWWRRWAWWSWRTRAGQEGDEVGVLAFPAEQGIRVDATGEGSLTLGEAGLTEVLRELRDELGRAGERSGER